MVREGIATLTIHRLPVKNAIDGRTMEELETAIALAEQDQDLRALILTGAGRDAFISGGDLRYFQSLVTDRQVLKMLVMMRREREEWEPLKSGLIKERKRTMPLLSRIIMKYSVKIVGC